MIHEALFGRRLAIQASRPVTFDIRVDKSDCPLGCVINYDLDIGSSLLVGEIRPGAIQVWNDAHPDRMVKANDRIVAVDSKRASGKELLDTIKARQGSFELTISRPKWMPTGL
eukprot:UN2718